MKRFIVLAALLIAALSASAQEKKLLNGFGGVIRLHIGEHFRVGSEGYVSTLNQRGNGSYLKYGWGGLLADFHMVFGRFQPYAGLTLGGGAMTTLLPHGPRLYFGFLFYH